MAVTLVGYPVSPFVRKVRVALEAKGIGYALDPVVPYTDREAVLAVNPAGTVPVLLTGGDAAPITESADIVAWAEERVPEPGLLPADGALRARAMELLRFADTQMAQVFGGMMFGQRIVVPFYFGKAAGKEALVARAMTEMAPPLLDAVAETLGDADYMAGDFSVADIAMASWLRGADLAGFRLDAARWPTVAAWLSRTYAQPGYASVIASEDETDVVHWARDRFGDAA
ncbi:glutathione S-transferase family protein [Pseudorhodobacter sp. E13]|uniref:glutathione S-transferase family protein n=1 Tax=Pseudorhodobacter sp. E13 TaxID=2487931 RepID=UPI000F8F1F02|nr:glutathione S-transferase family protein [Pseudorhodobacter sp. E13]RUS65001.1 glutathione S-transferase family protein [Pseudorhodobacter sp. E13]